MTIVISSIAVLAMWPPFVAERVFWNKGKRQTEAQRDAQMAMRAMARVARQSNTSTVFNPSSPPSNFTEIEFLNPFGGSGCFTGFVGGAFAGQLWLRETCESPNTTVLIDGVRSRITSIAAEEVVDDRLLRVRVVVSHRLRGGPNPDPRQEDEILETKLFLRNG